MRRTPGGFSTDVSASSRRPRLLVRNSIFPRGYSGQSQVRDQFGLRVCSVSGSRW
jgi:hypothetical protein